MVIVRFRNREEHKDLLKKVKKMKEYAEMIEDCLVESIEDDDEDYRYRDDDEYEETRRGGSRYSYRRGGGSRGGRM
jgi:hypothetical protein